VTLTQQPTNITYMRQHIHTLDLVSITNTLAYSNATFIVKNPFGLSSDTFQLSIIYKSYRQVLTPVNNSQLLLKLEILDKLRLVTFHKLCTTKVQH
jgi:hypothetical protein